jgi:uncharacterized membrane protein
MGTIKKFLKLIDLWLIGGAIYYLTEIIWRGCSHWTMFGLGGVCFVVMGEINKLFSWKTPFWIQCGISAVIITILEFTVGCVVNLVFHMNVWDYSDKPFNLLGQICPQMFPIWIILSGIGIVLDDILRWQLFNEEKPRYKIF